LYKPSGQQYWRAWLAHNYLSGPPTFAVNATSALVELNRQESASTMAAGIDRVVSKVTGKPRSLMVPPREVLAISYAEGMRHAAQAMAQTIKTGHTPLDDINSIGSGAEVFKGSWLAKALELSGVETELSKQIGQGAANGVKRGMLGTDAAFQMMGIYPQAYRKAAAASWNAGKRGADLAADIQQRMQDYDIFSDEAVRKYAGGITYATPHGPIGRKLQGWLNAIDDVTKNTTDKMWELRHGAKTLTPGQHYKPLQVTVGYMHGPFMRMAGALTKDMAKSIVDAPVGAGKLALGHGDYVENLTQLSRGIQTYTVAAALVGAYQSGLVDFVTTMPENDFERTNDYGAWGKQPWSIGVGGRYIPMQSLGSLGMAMAPLATVLKGVENGDKDATWGDALAALAKVSLDQTGVRNFVLAYEGMTGPPHKRDQWLGTLASGVIPPGAAGRFVRDLRDPFLRDPNDRVGNERKYADASAPVQFASGIIENVKAGLPGLSESVRPKLNMWGEPIERPIVWKRVAGTDGTGEDFVATELRALHQALPSIAGEDDGIYPGDLKSAANAFEKTLEREVNEGAAIEDMIPVRLTDQERQQYMTLRGTAIHEALATVIAPDNPEWTALSPKEKKSMVKALKAIGADLAKEMFLESWLGETSQP
jgi:hypothetical protein